MVTIEVIPKKDESNHHNNNNKEEESHSPVNEKEESNPAAADPIDTSDSPSTTTTATTATTATAPSPQHSSSIIPPEDLDLWQAFDNLTLEDDSLLEEFNPNEFDDPQRLPLRSWSPESVFDLPSEASQQTLLDLNESELLEALEVFAVDSVPLPPQEHDDLLLYPEGILNVFDEEEPTETLTVPTALVEPKNNPTTTVTAPVTATAKTNNNHNKSQSKLNHFRASLQGDSLPFCKPCAPPPQTADIDQALVEELLERAHNISTPEEEEEFLALFSSLGLELNSQHPQVDDPTPFVPPPPLDQPPFQPSLANDPDQAQLLQSFQNLGLRPIDEELPEEATPELDQFPLDMNSLPLAPNNPSFVDQDFQNYTMQIPQSTLRMALRVTESFGCSLIQVSDTTFKKTPPNERMLLAHKEIIYGMQFDSTGQYLATASQDGTVKIWTEGRVVASLPHSKDAEVLRVAWASPTWASKDLDRLDKHYWMLASSGADAKLRVYAAPKDSIAEMTLLCELNHQDDFDLRDPLPEPPQIYGLAFVDTWKGLTSGDMPVIVTGSEDYVHVWEIENVQASKMYLAEILSTKFSDLNQVGWGVRLCPVTSSGLADPNGSVAPVTLSTNVTGHRFGGERNPDNTVFTFDISYHAEAGLLGVALSDGTLRILNGRGVCVSVLSLPGCQSHLTSLAWNTFASSQNGQQPLLQLASTVATGHIILWELHPVTFQPSCKGILEGRGHTLGRPLYGAQFISSELLLSWGSDGKVCLW
ncbi:MAG: hypothetical protein AAGJ35_02430, partial [Myxococcota bacterium]